MEIPCRIASAPSSGRYFARSLARFPGLAPFFLRLKFLGQLRSFLSRRRRRRRQLALILLLAAVRPRPAASGRAFGVRRSVLYLHGSNRDDRFLHNGRKRAPP